MFRPQLVERGVDPTYHRLWLSFPGMSCTGGDTLDKN